jgi:hypothetical protein
MGFEAGSDGLYRKAPAGRGGRMGRELELPNAICNKEVIQYMIHDDLLHHRSQDVPREAYGSQGTGRSA